MYFNYNPTRRQQSNVFVMGKIHRIGDKKGKTSGFSELNNINRLKSLTTIKRLHHAMQLK